MNLYEYQRSRSFIDLGPMSLRFRFSNLFSLDTDMPIEAKFHVEPPWNGGMEVCSNVPGDIKPFKIFFSGTKQLMTLKVGT